MGLAGLAKGWAPFVIDWAALGLGWPSTGQQWSAATRGLLGHELGQVFAWQAMVWAGRSLSLVLTVPAAGWDFLWLGSLWMELDIGWAIHSLGWPQAGLAMG
jgi:hypothetical protein